MKSILQDKKICFICKKSICLHDHHIYFGTARRKISEKYGFKVWLCYEHHQGTYGVHGTKGHKLDLYLKQTCQRKYEEKHTREDFRKIIGKSYIKEETNE